MNTIINFITVIDPPETPFTPTKSLSKRFGSSFSIAYTTNSPKCYL